MNLHDFSTAMEQNAFGPDHPAFLLPTDPEKLPCGCCAERLQEARQLCTDLLRILPPDGAELLSACADCFEANLRYASRYAFICGLTAVFSCHAGLPTPSDGGYHTMVTEALFQVPGMKAHSDFEAGQHRIRTLEARLRAMLPDEARQKLETLCCLFSARVSRCAMCGFCVGYCTGFHILEELNQLTDSHDREQLETVRQTLGCQIPFFTVS